MNDTWLDVGHGIWASESFNFERDYYLPLPAEDFDSARPVMAEYMDATAISQMVLQDLRVPVLVPHSGTGGNFSEWAEGNAWLIEAKCVA